MIAKIKSFTVVGIEAYPIEIEVDVSLGLPSINIVGLPNNAVKESRSRTKSASELHKHGNGSCTRLRLKQDDSQNLPQLLTAQLCGELKSKAKC